MARRVPVVQSAAVDDEDRRGRRQGVKARGGGVKRKGRSASVFRHRRKPLIFI
jgi:hypothetical protein